MTTPGSVDEACAKAHIAAGLANDARKNVLSRTAILAMVVYVEVPVA
jgi:hypothetical protein